MFNLFGKYFLNCSYSGHIQAEEVQNCPIGRVERRWKDCALLSGTYLVLSCCKGEVEKRRFCGHKFLVV